MSTSTSTAETLTRPRIILALVSALAAFSIGYYTYRTNLEIGIENGIGRRAGGLRRSNAVRRRRRRRRSRRASQGNADAGWSSSSLSSSASEAAGDENANVDAPFRLAQDEPEDQHALQDGETVADPGSDEWWNFDSGSLPSQRTGYNIVNLLFRVSEDNAKRNGCIHRGSQCNACGMSPIRGVRYRCANCADFDLCETCETQGIHIKTHIFYKIRVPVPPPSLRQLQPVWYTGDPDTCHRSLPKNLIPNLSRDTGFERPELEAAWEQWTFMANAEWREDPDELFIAMDRKTFERCLVPTGGSRHAAPNLIHDRMFAFYDTNNDGLIGFTEFLHGLSYRKQKNKLRKIFDGYDIDCDGFADRQDFLRMFRAYYVVYKQLHREILDGLEDQLLSSTEAQQLVTSRQPLSSHFGREERLPNGVRGFGRLFEGKRYRSDGSIDISDGFHQASADNKTDTASREDILTTLFAFQSDQDPQQRFVTNRDNDSNWRTVRRLSGNEVGGGEAYWRALLQPPTRLDQLPDVVLGARSVDDEDEEDCDSPLLTSEEEDMGMLNPRYENQHLNPDAFLDDDDHNLRPTNETAARKDSMAKTRRRAPKLDKRRRKMARAQLHERWKRRQFYIDEEEGGVAPEGWNDDEDILDNIRERMQSAKAAEPRRTRSRSSSKVRFAEDLDDFEDELYDDDDDNQSNVSTFSRSIPERWGGMVIPVAERDTGKEILYQVTQQAFNELLDTIFKPAEDLAVQAAKTDALRKKYKSLLDRIELDVDGRKPTEMPHHSSPADKPIPDKTLGELLDETGYTVNGPHDPRNMVEQGSPDRDDPDDDGVDVEYETTSVESEAALESIGYYDPTMPQFRPDSETESEEYFPGDVVVYEPCYPLTPQTSSRPGPAKRVENVYSIPEEDENEEPSHDLLQLWKRLNVAEETAIKRGGWGKISFTEFEETWKSQEIAGNRLDYLGSWIDFCIP